MDGAIKITVYIDDDFRCHAEPAEGLRAVETDMFDGREHLIGYYRLIPDSESWTRADGVVFGSGMIAPAEPLP